MVDNPTQQRTPYPAYHRRRGTPSHPTPETQIELPPLADFFDTTSLIHKGDPHTPIFTPTDSPLDHWLLRLPSNKHSHYELATTTTTDTEYSDHLALTAHIPKIGDNTSPPPNLSPQIPTTRDHPPFLLRIPKPLIDLYHLGNTNTQTTLEKASKFIQDLTTSYAISPTHIEKAAKYVINMIDTYYTHAQTIYGQLPSKHPPRNPKNSDL